MVDRLLTKKNVSEVIDTIFRFCGQKETVLFCDKIKTLGFKHAFKAGISFGKDDLIIPEDKNTLLEKTQSKVQEYENQYQDGLITQGEKYNKVVDAWSKCSDLVAAAMMAKAGKKVLVLESREEIGGLASTHEFAPGFKCNTINDTIKWVDPRIVKELEIQSKDLELIDIDIKRIALGEKENKHIVFHKDPLLTCDSIADHSSEDSKKWIDFTTHIEKLTRFLEKLYQLTPPSLPNFGLFDALSMRSLLGPLMGQGPQGLVDLARTCLLYTSPSPRDRT